MIFAKIVMYVFKECFCGVDMLFTECPSVYIYLSVSLADGSFEVRAGIRSAHPVITNPDMTTGLDGIAVMNFNNTDSDFYIRLRRNLSEEDYLYLAYNSGMLYSILSW